MKRIITSLLILFAFMQLNAQMITKKEAKEIILKDMVGLEYYSPVVGEMGYKKIADAEIDSKDMFSFKDKAGKDLFWFNIENTTMEHDTDALSIWYGYYNYKVKSNKSKGSKIAHAFNSLKKMDEAGTEILPLKEYDDIDSFHDGLAAVSLNDKHGFINQQGKEVIPLKYDNAYFFRDGLAPVSLNEKFGFVDQKDNIIIPLKYDHAYFFTDGLAAVNLNGKHGYIDVKGNVVIPFKYDDASPFSGGRAGVELNGERLYIDKTGKLID